MCWMCLCWSARFVVFAFVFDPVVVVALVVGVALPLVICHVCVHVICENFGCNFLNPYASMPGLLISGPRCHWSLFQKGSFWTLFANVYKLFGIFNAFCWNIGRTSVFVNRSRIFDTRSRLIPGPLLLTIPGPHLRSLLKLLKRTWN